LGSFNKIVNKVPKMFFTEEEQAKIVEAIKAAEKNTSGEIKVHIATTSQWEDVVKQATLIFDQLELEKTKQRNGVLIYIAKEDRQFAIWGDVGINRVVPEGYWESTIDLMRSYMKVGQYAEGVIKGIHMIGIKLKKYFPLETDDKNELSDEISFG
jgi:uncharacterized membrane protein